LELECQANYNAALKIDFPKNAATFELL